MIGAISDTYVMSLFLSKDIVGKAATSLYSHLPSKCPQYQFKGGNMKYQVSYREQTPYGWFSSLVKETIVEAADTVDAIKKVADWGCNVLTATRVK